MTNAAVAEALGVPPRRSRDASTVGSGAQPLRRRFVASASAGFGEAVERLDRLLRRLRRVAVRLLQLGEDLFAVHVDRARRLDAEAHLIAAHLEHRHDDLVPDHDALIRTSREHEHEVPPPWRPP